MKAFTIEGIYLDMMQVTDIWVDVCVGGKLSD